MIESARARQAWADYLALGDGRTLDSLVREYQSRTGSVPTKQLSRLKEWSRHFDWQGRLKTLADKEAADLAALRTTRKREALESGLALAYERVITLKDLSSRLRDDFELWVETVKLAPNGDQVKVLEFNASELRELRGLLDDLAKETGGRVKKAEVSGTLEVDLHGARAQLAARIAAVAARRGAGSASGDAPG